MMVPLAARMMPHRPPPRNATFAKHEKERAAFPGSWKEPERNRRLKKKHTHTQISDDTNLRRSAWGQPEKGDRAASHKSQQRK
jgi:hypothetical protein